MHILAILAILGIIAALIILGLILWRNTCPLKHVLNPTHRAGGYATPHVLVLVIAFLAVFALGVGATAAYNADYFTSHYRQNDQSVPQGPAPIFDYKQPGAPASATVQIRALDPVRNQGQIGSCAGQVTAELVGYEWRVNGPHRPWIRLSARYPYSYYSNTYNGGNDGGSTPPQDAEVLANLGLIKYNQDPDPPYGIENPLPTFSGINRLHTPITWHSIADNPGAGYGLVDGIKNAIAAGHPVGIGIQVLHTYDEATQNNGMTDIPLDGNMAVRGGHEIEGIAYNDSIQFRDSAGNVVATGGVLTRGSWGPHFGLHGMVWISYRYLAQYGFLTGYFTLTTSASGPLPPYTPNHGPKHLIAPPGTSLRPGATAYSWTVRGVVTRDTHVDISAAVNYWGTREHVWPVGIVAVLATESGINQYADRWGTPPDVSFGIAQATVNTANAYGIYGDAYAVRAQLDNLDTSIAFAARFLADAQRASCLSFPTLYVAYNEGPGLGCNAYTYYHPTGQAYSNYEFNFLPNFRYVVNTYSGSPAPQPTPKPAPFPLKLWGHHVSAYSHHRLTYAATLWLKHGPHRAGVAVSNESWHPSGRGGVNGYEEDGFRYLTLYWWPRHANWTPKWHGR